MRGYADLVRELGGDPAAFLARFGIPAGAEQQAGRVRLLRRAASACWRPAPRSCGVRTSGFASRGWQGLDILGPIAVIARNAQTVLGGLRGDRALPLRPLPRVDADGSRRAPEAGLGFTYEMTEPGVPYIQGYELSMGIAVRIIRLLGGPQARPRSGLVHACPAGLGRRLPRALGCPVRFEQTVVRVRAVGADGRHGASRTPIPRPDASPRNTLSPPTCPALRAAVRTRGRTDPPAAAHRPMQRRRHRRRTRDASADAAAATGRRGRALSGHHRPGTPRPGGALPRRAGTASQPDRRPARLFRTERAQPVVPALVRKDAAAIPGEPFGDHHRAKGAHESDQRVTQCPTYERIFRYEAGTSTGSTLVAACPNSHPQTETNCQEQQQFSRIYDRSGIRGPKRLRTGADSPYVEVMSSVDLALLPIRIGRNLVDTVCACGHTAGTRAAGGARSGRQNARRGAAGGATARAQLPAPAGWPFGEEFPRTCGTGRLADGALFWTDFLYDDHGATGAPGAAA